MHDALTVSTDTQRDKIWHLRLKVTQELRGRGYDGGYDAVRSGGVLSVSGHSMRRSTSICAVRSCQWPNLLQ